MKVVLTIAGLSVKEAWRRKFLFAAALIALLFVLMGFLPIHSHRMQFLDDKTASELIAAIMSTRGAGMISFFGFLFSVALASATISQEVERGILCAIVPKPISRWSIYLGKWLGINAVIIVWMAVWAAILQWAIFHHIHQTVPGLWTAIPALMLYAILFTSLTMFFSAFTSNLLAVILPMIMASVAWSEWILKSFGYAFDIATLKALAKVVVYVVPINPLSRWVERDLNQTILNQIPLGMHFGPQDPPAGALDLAWVLGYAALALVAGIVVFERRDIAG